MSENVVLPALGESVTEGTVTRWLKKVGETVAVDEPLVEVSTDKVDTEIPSPVAGVIEQILVQEDETVQVGAVLAVIGSGSGAPAAAPAPAAEPVAAPVVEAPAPAPVVEAPVTFTPPAAPVVTPAPAVAPVATPAAAPVASTDPGYVTPLVRKFAAENGIDLSAITGTGVGGRIRKEDVLTSSIPVVSATPAAPAPVAAAAPLQVSALRGTTEPMSRLRKAVSYTHLTLPKNREV